jgi:hypothetical protein
MNRDDFLDGSKVLYTYDARGSNLKTGYFSHPHKAIASTS